MELEEIAQKEKFVLFDTSVNDLGGFLEEIYPTRKYSEIKYEDIIFVKEEILSIIDFINYENVFTIKEVVEELHNLQIKLSDTAKYLNKKEKELKKKKIKIKKDERNKKEYYILLEKTNDLIQKVGKNIKNLKENNVYNIMYNSILDMSKILSNLIKNPYIYHDELNRQPKIFQKKKKKIKTDEHLVAMLFYSSGFDRKSSALISRDDGIFNLTDQFYKFICADESSNCQCLKETLIENPARLYLPNPPNSSNYELRFSSKDPYASYELQQEKKQLIKLKKKGFELLKF